MNKKTSGKIAIIGAGISGLLLSEKLIKEGCEVSLLGPTDERPQTICSWRSAETPLPQREHVIQSWQSWQMMHNGERNVQRSSRYRYEAINALSMKKSLEDSLSQSLKFNRVRQKVHSLIPETNSMQILTDKEEYRFSVLFDTRAPKRSKDCCLQQFTGMYLNVSPKTLNIHQPILMDFDVSQAATDGVTFVYALPLGEKNTLVEATQFGMTAVAPEVLTDIGREWIEKRSKTTLPTSSFTSKEQGLFPMGSIIPQSRHTIPFGVAAGATRPATGYALRGIEHQLDLISPWMKTKKAPAFKYSATARFMDSIFLKVLQNDPSIMKSVFWQMGQKIDGDIFASFLCDEGGLRGAFSAAMAVPKRSFIRQAFRR